MMFNFDYLKGKGAMGGKGKGLKGGGKVGGGKKGKGNRGGKAAADRKGPSQSDPAISCKCCGSEVHVKKDCWHKEKQCSRCLRYGHLVKMCSADLDADALRQKKKSIKDANKDQVDDKDEEESEPEKQWPCPECYHWNSIKNKNCAKQGCKGKVLKNMAVPTDDPAPKSGISKNTQKMIEQMSPEKLQAEIVELQERVDEADRQIAFYRDDKKFAFGISSVDTSAIEKQKRNI